MKCEDFLAWHETGGPFRRLAAFCHALRCTDCSTVKKAMEKARLELAQTEPLDTSQRQLWERACWNSTPMSAATHRRALWMAAAPCACAVALLLLFFLTDWNKENGPGTAFPLARHQRAPVVVTDVRDWDADREYALLETGIAQLQTELDELAQLAERLDATQQASNMLDTFSGW